MKNIVLGTMTGPVDVDVRYPGNKQQAEKS